MFNALRLALTTTGTWKQEKGCIFRTLLGEPILNLWIKTAETRDELAWVSHFCFKWAATLCCICKALISRFYVTTKYTGATKNKHISMKQSSVDMGGPEWVATFAFSTCTTGWNGRVPTLTMDKHTGWDQHSEQSPLVSIRFTLAPER